MSKKSSLLMACCKRRKMAEGGMVDLDSELADDVSILDELNIEAADHEEPAIPSIESDENIISAIRARLRAKRMSK